jgi:divalent metal cation (Fe/Co/Zn/Cd) transporter
LVVAIGIVGNLMGYPLLDPVAALIVGFMVSRMGWGFAWNAMNDLMDRAAEEEEVAAIRQTLRESEGVLALPSHGGAPDRWFSPGIRGRKG